MTPALYRFRTGRSCPTLRAHRAILRRRRPSPPRASLRVVAGSPPRSEHRKRVSELKYRFFLACGLALPQEHEAQTLRPFLPNGGKRNPYLERYAGSWRNLCAPEIAKELRMDRLAQMRNLQRSGIGATSTPPRSIWQKGDAHEEVYISKLRAPRGRNDGHAVVRVRRNGRQ